jgi:hypothetical protein
MPEFRVNYAIIEKYVQRSDKRAKVYTSMPKYISNHGLFSCTDDLVKCVHKRMHQVSIHWVQDVANECTMQWLDEQVPRELRSSVFWDPDSNPSEVLPRRFVVVNR